MDLRNLSQLQKISILIFHFLLGASAFYNPELLKLNVFSVFVVSIIYLFMYRNKSELIPFFVMYLIGMEVFSRMAKAVIYWEFTKYAVTLLLLLAWLLEKRHKVLYKPILAYFLLLIPAIFVGAQHLDMPELRKQISFNLSGPLCLTVSSIYFYKRKINFKDLSYYVFYLINPILSMGVYMVIFMPALSEAKFGTYSNFTFSGGYGPNQVATILGAAVLMLSLSFLLKERAVNTVIDLVLTVFFLTLAYFTFSRGGVITSILALFCGVASIQVNTKLTVRNIRWFFVGIIISLLLVQVWLSVNFASNGALSDRYGEMVDTKDSDVPSFTGRTELFLADIDIFFRYIWTGCGVGYSTKLHEEYILGLSAHTEYSRLLAEHGLLGFFSLIIFLTVPIFSFMQVHTRQERLFLTSLSIFVFLTMAHSATRLTIPVILYGLSLAKLQYTSPNRI